SDVFPRRPVAPAGPDLQLDSGRASPAPGNRRVGLAGDATRLGVRIPIRHRPSRPGVDPDGWLSGRAYALPDRGALLRGRPAGPGPAPPGGPRREGPSSPDRGNRP